MQKDVENTWLQIAIGGEWECFLGKGSFFVAVNISKTNINFQRAEIPNTLTKKAR